MSINTEGSGSVSVNLGKGIGDGIDSSQWYIKSAAREAVEAAIEAAEQAADINSPSRLARDKVGLNIGYGIGGGAIDGLNTMIPDIKLGLTDAMSAIGSGINAMDSFINADNRTNTKQTVIHQTNHFDRYSSRDGAAAVRDLNRQLGWAY